MEGILQEIFEIVQYRSWDMVEYTLDRWDEHHSVIMRGCLHFYFACWFSQDYEFLKNKVVEETLDVDQDGQETETEIQYSSWDMVQNRWNKHHSKSIRACLQFCCLFPQDYEFQKDDIIQLWIAQELLAVAQNETAVYSNLVERGSLYFEEFEKWKIFILSSVDHSTHLQRYKLNKYVFHLLQQHHDDDAYSRVDDVNSNFSDNTLYSSIYDSSIDAITLEKLYHAKRLCALLILHENGSILNHVPREVFLKLPWISVLDLNGTNIKDVPSSIGKLKNLRYLNLSGTSIARLPESVCSLHQMQILKLKACLKLVSLPKGMRRLVKLQYLDVDVARLLVSMPPGFGDLTDLHHLPAFVVGKESGCCITELKEMVNLHGTLRILRLENVSNSKEAADAALVRKKHVVKLQLQWTEFQDGIQFEVLQNLQPHTQIEELQIVGFPGFEFPSWIGNPQFSKLVKVTLHDCRKCKLLPPLGKLPFLKHLFISDMHAVQVIDTLFCGRDMVGGLLGFRWLAIKATTQFKYINMYLAFPSLENLVLTGMPALEKWIGIKKGDFHHLQKLCITCCPKLTSLPELSLLLSLQQLEISLCTSLRSLPNKGLPISLQCLIIMECPLLKEWCLKEAKLKQGKLANIPNIWIDDLQISLQPEDFQLKDTSPHLSGGAYTGDKFTSTYDLVEQMQYLYIRVVKAKDLPVKDVTGSLDPYVEVKLGNHKGTTRHFEKKTNPEWNEVFAFSKERTQSTHIEVLVKDKDFVKDDIVGGVIFDLKEVPDSPLAPQWYRVQNWKENRLRGKLMLAVWWGTQADEAFSEASHSDAAAVSSDGVANIRSKMYLSPKLWYARVNIIEVQDLQPSDKGRYQEVYVKAVLGNQALRTRISQSKSINPMWNEDLMFVAAEPFEEHLILSVEDRVAPNKDEVLGKCVISLQNVDRRRDHKLVHSRWYNLEKHVIVDGEEKKDDKFASRIHLRICLDGGYHVLDESTHYSSDLRPTDENLWKPVVGRLELGVLSAQGLIPMKTKDGRGTTDAYCVAKYGQKWVRTRTINDSFAPKWNEQYTWDVYDPCTVITIGVFDNWHLHGADKSGGAKDSRIGKVRIRLSTLETDRVYAYSYPLLVLHSSGVKKMGEIQLTVRFSCASMLNTLYISSLPLLPKMHYLHPLSVMQLDSLRHQATQIVSMRLSRAEPPLRKEIVEYMLDVDSHMWSMRRSKANFFRIMNVFGGIFAVFKWFDQICHWKNPLKTVLIHVLFLILVLYPELILPMIFLYLFLLGIWNYRWRPRHPLCIDTQLSHVDKVHPDELDEEFDSFPTSRPSDIVMMRYDRLRSVAGRINTAVGDLATQGERLQSLLSWRDSRATALFVIFYFIAAIVLYVTPYQVVALSTGFYMLRHPRFRNKLPSRPLNFFRRLPARTDNMF